MPKIQVLDSHVADLIAAGEVVERPASVAKELMENAIDAGASKVTVEIARGGMTFLRVTDDGRGIPAGELKTAFLRHATSKLRTEYDLEAIGTLGFRGEALAAISAVSRVEVMSRTADSPLGASLALEGGVPGEVEEAGCPLGTTMVVRDLFFNTPARLKFVKKDTAEGAAVFSVVQRVALSHPEVSVKFIRDGKQELLTPGDGQLKSAVYAVLGRELALGFREVKAGGEDMTVTGFVSMPACCRASRSWQFFFVNGRQVKSPMMAAALEEAYKNQKMVGRFPGCVLHLETKLSAVDVNVHPAKTEVKFGNERQVFSAIYHAVLSALEADRSRPALTLEGRNTALPGFEGKDAVTPSQTVLSPKPRVADGGAAVRMPAAPAWSRGGEPKKANPPGSWGVVSPARPRTVETIPSPAPVKQMEPEKKLAPAAVTPEPVAPVSRTVVPVAEVAPVEHKVPVEPAPVENIPVVETAKAEQVPIPVEKPVAQPASVPAEEVSPAEPEQQAIATEAEAAQEPWRVAGEVLNTYIIVEQGERVFFIDKHAAHERMNFDRMKAQGYDPMAQTLLTPVVCRLGAEEREALLAHQELLEEFGFDVDELGRDLAVRQAPFDVEVGDIEATLEELARKLITTGSADPAAARDELLHTMACKAAIKGGWKTSGPELERVAKAVMDGTVKYCPHGRPVAIELTKKELEKQFKRA
ncbi:DNA mismatch repair endonuclease MutL [Pseudoflavonifractor sp. AF19-9AC]|uniref:DNA mismatch repair endonuclease MutL n=1 Tax=Pseudoflavonifractor sp. AF19-9AC TaxID=2292244 RepID=UPI000E536CBB|nr:DNA mismatch repair endonuclease MutL [Pseudoflavonifractor sp. AF19-9AC]RHR10793.1 DNA mismatch repair endonuclease MutL [Pseudoflavonifractor sp. AF19-9AC]